MKATVRTKLALAVGERIDALNQTGRDVLDTMNSLNTDVKVKGL